MKGITRLLIAMCLAAPTAALALPITIDYTDSGWYDRNGVHNASNQNYIAGLNDQYRDFFVFDTSSVTENIVSATFRVFSASVTGSGTYNLFDVDTDVNTLTAGGSGKIGIYNDLGTGASLGSTFVNSTDDNKILEISLSAAAVDALNAGSGLFALGGTFDSSGHVYGFSHQGNPVRQLVLETGSPVAVSEPGTLALLGLGLTALVTVRRRRTTQA